MAGDIFISYRSTEAGVVGQLYDGLINVGGFDPWQMWRDRNSLVAGKEWFSQIENASSRARVLVAVIGRGWRPKDSKGDWVTRELAMAFAHEIPVLPVLLGDARMPNEEDLPEELVLLCSMQGLRIANPPVDGNFHDLARALRRSGVRPARNTDPWGGAGKHIHIAPSCTELQTGLAAGDASVILLTVADLADAATNGREAGTRPGDSKSLWQQIRESDQDEVIVRCREVDRREVITFTSAVWRSHLANRADKWLRERRTRALAERYRDSAQAGNHYDDWVVGADLFSRIGANEDAGRSYLIAARLARERLSDDVAAFRYRQARNCFSFAAATDDPTERARALTVMAFACLQAVSLRLRTAARELDQIDVAVREELEDDLDIAHKAVAELRHAVRLLPSASGMGLIENLALDLSDSYLSDADRLSARCHSLAAHWGILHGQLLLLGGRPLDQDQLGSDEPEWRFAGALRDAEQGLAGSVRRYLVIVAATGMTRALTIKAEGLAADHRHGQSRKALKNVVATALFHACRAWLLLDRCGDLFRDALSAPDLEHARGQLVDCFKRLSDSRFQRCGDSRGATRQLWPEAGPTAWRTPLPDLTRAWAKALAPRRHRHMKQVAVRARELAAKMASDDRRLCRDEDIGTVAFAHDLFRDVEPSRVLALFRELGMPGGRSIHHGGPATVTERDEHPAEWIGPAEWTTPILLHGRLAAVFLDRILDARSRLGSDRFTPVERALATHTIGERDAPALSRLLVVADTLSALAGDEDTAPAATTEWRRRIDEACVAEPDLIKAYQLCIEARVEHLNRIGTTPGEAASELLNALRSPGVRPAAKTPAAPAPHGTCIVKP